MIIIKNNDYYNKEFTNDIEEYTFDSTTIEQDLISINNLSSQLELDISLAEDLVGKTRISLKIPLEV